MMVTVAKLGLAIDRYIQKSVTKVFAPSIWAASPMSPCKERKKAYRKNIVRGSAKAT